MFNRMEAIMSTASITNPERAEQWRERLAQQAGSGKSVAAFCQEQGLATQTFYWWRSRLSWQKAGAAPRPAAATSFLDLGAIPAAAEHAGSLSIRLELPGGIILTMARS